MPAFAHQSGCRLSLQCRTLRPWQSHPVTDVNMTMSRSLAGMREDRRINMVQPTMLQDTHATIRFLHGLSAPISRVGEPEQRSHEPMLVGQSRPCQHASPSSTCSVGAGIQDLHLHIRAGVG